MESTKPEEISNSYIERVESMNNTTASKPGYFDETLGASSHRKSKEERRLVTKLDLLILPLATLIYLVISWDRNNIGNARLMGLQKELGMTNGDFYNAVTIYYVGYIVFMLPGNVFIRSIKAHRQISLCLVSLGVFVCCMAASKNTATIIGLRILIGSASVFVQGLGIYLSFWYKRDEVITRGGLYYSAYAIAGGFSGLIAYGIEKNINGALGRPAWQWIFIIQGVAAIFVGIIVYIALPLAPDQLQKRGKGHWLFTKEEIEMAVARMKTYNAVGAKFEPVQIWAALKDPKTWLFSVMNAGIAIALISLGSFLPSFINDFGYSPIKSQLFSVIPYACAFVTLISLNTISDRLNMKGLFFAVCLIISIVGYIILLNTVEKHVQMGGACLVVAGTFPSVTFLATWIGINTGGFTKRASTWAIVEIIGQSFAILGTRIYDKPPRYIKGHAIVLSFQILALLSVAACYFYMQYQNKAKKKALLEHEQRGEAHPGMEKSLEEVYDYHPLFVYTL